jgi:hypothetical protein
MRTFEKQSLIVFAGEDVVHCNLQSSELIITNSLLQCLM